ncbi:alpha-ribazole-5'-phosphate phosphatase [Halobacillus andaensis]|uniref:Alpha-ribazole-5'-phosphate phosphatase n=1 Tax=Halobacillus andaensis TaxID=1176239 RepID=A0A917B7C1_HALAA|nr:histidine phosphatase family protein [Halobacillus andaensis]MBP2005189.1 alpha-ribazole phosphatase [Halobacillus andaensis]GGF29537.1 alpha-ribazole-5'-phosphate phosphatase [Halobacillus andaensis]
MVDHLDLYLIRHGETVSNRQKRYIGWREEPLTEEGVDQIKQLRKKLPLMEFVYASDLSRCRETAGILSLVFREEKALREYDFGDFDGKSYEELKDEEGYRRWLDDMENESPINGESFSQFKGRVLQFMAALLETCEDAASPIALVTHGGVIRTLLQHFSKQTNSMWEWSMDPGEAYHIQLLKEGDEWILLQAERITAN